MREKEIQEKAMKLLESANLFPFSVVYTLALDDSGVLGITFFTEQDLIELLDFLDYKRLCDKSDIILIKDSKTILLKDSAVIRFFTTWPSET